MARSGIRATCHALVAVLLCLVAASAHEEADRGTSPVENPAQPLLIQFRHGRLRAELHRAPWDQVLTAIERQTGVAIQVKGQLSGTVTQAFDGLPLEQGLRRLFTDAHVVVFYAPTSRDGGTEARVSHVWLMPKASPTSDTPPTEISSPLNAAADTPPEPDERLTSLQTFAVQGDLEGLQRALVDPDQNIQAMALELLWGRGPQGIIDALRRATRSDQKAGT